jgi:hypothetical protein
MANYSANPSAYNSTVFINTPISSDSAGNITFGFQVTGSNPLGLQGGLARISAAGSGIWVSASTAASDAAMKKVVHNCAPAYTLDESALYVAVTNMSGFGFGFGYLLKLNSTTLATIATKMVTVFKILLDGGAKSVKPIFGTCAGILVSDRAQGSFFQNGPERNGLSRTNLYSSPTLAPGTSVDHTPSPSSVRGAALGFQSLKLPATATLLAKGAQTRNATPLS